MALSPNGVIGKVISGTINLQQILAQLTRWFVSGNIVIPGAGVSGALSALKLAEKYPRATIHLFDKDKQILSPRSASGVQPGRAGLGFHYFHQETALIYLRATVAFLLEYIDECPAMLRDHDKSLTHPRRRGCYGVLKGSVKEAEIKATYEALKEEYRRLCQQHPKLESILGQVDNFYRFLSIEEANQRFEGLAEFDETRYAFVIETAENLLDTDVFAKFIREKIAVKPNIKFHPEHELTNLEVSSSRFLPYYTSTFKTAGQTLVGFNSHLLIIATWATADFFAKMVGGQVKNPHVTNRLKGKIVVKLPDELHEMGSLFIGMRQGCMMTNLGNGFAHMTASEYTNITRHEVKDGTLPPEEYVRYLDNQLSYRENREIAKKILSRVVNLYSCNYRKYLKKLKKKHKTARSQKSCDTIKQLSEKITLLETKYKTLEKIALTHENFIGFQTVQIDGPPNFDDPDSELHKRTNLGVEAYPEQPGLFKVVSRKFFYGVTVTEQLGQLTDIHYFKTYVLAPFIKVLLGCFFVSLGCFFLINYALPILFAQFFGDSTTTTPLAFEWHHENSTCDAPVGENLAVNNISFLLGTLGHFAKGTMINSDNLCLPTLPDLTMRPPF